MVVSEAVAGFGVLSGAIVSRIGHGVYHSRDHGKKLAKERYNDVRLSVLMAMLVHWCYFRDLNPLEEAAAWFMEYNNKRAKKYGELHWEPHPCDEQYPGELKYLGLAFLRKRINHSDNPNAPDLAIVLRGTIPTNLADLEADWKIGIQKFDHTHRVVRTSELILQVVKKFRKDYPGKQICMAGHSLGAAIALIVGGCLYSSTHKIDIETHLFNPPLLTLVDVANWGVPTAPEDTCRFKLNFSVIKEALIGNKAATINKEWEQFQRLQHWVPKLHLNPGDPICREFISFYTGEGRRVRSPGDIISPQGVLSGLFSENVRILKNVVPSADLYISTWRANPKWYAKHAPGLLKEVVAGRLPHSLRQWHKYTEEYIGLDRVHHARLLCRQPYSLTLPIVPF